MSETPIKIEHIKNADEEAIKSLYVDYKKPFFLFASRYQISSDDLLDIYQDAVVAFCENAKKGKIDHLQSGIKTYLFAIGKFMIFKKLKQNNDMVALEELNEYGIIIEEDEYDDQVLLLKEGFKKLGKQCREILYLFYYEEKKLDEIQIILSYTNKDVLKAQKSRCLKKLKEIIHTK